MPYLVKVTMNGEGVKNNRNYDYVVYGWPPLADERANLIYSLYCPSFLTKVRFILGKVSFKKHMLDEFCFQAMVMNEVRIWYMAKCY